MLLFLFLPFLGKFLFGFLLHEGVELLFVEVLDDLFGGGDGADGEGDILLVLDGGVVHGVGFY